MATTTSGLHSIIKSTGLSVYVPFDPVSGTIDLVKYLSVRYNTGDSIGELLLSGRLLLTGDLSVTGNLVVEGSTVQTGDVSTTDNIVLINDAVSSDTIVADDTKGAGLGVRVTDTPTYEHILLFNSSVLSGSTYSAYDYTSVKSASSYIWYINSDIVCNNMVVKDDIIINRSGYTKLNDIIDTIENQPTYNSDITSLDGTADISSADGADLSTVQFANNIAVTQSSKLNYSIYEKVINTVPSFYSDSSDISYVNELSNVFLDEISSNITNLDDVVYVKYLMKIFISKHVDNVNGNSVKVEFRNAGNFLVYPLFEVIPDSTIDVELNLDNIILPIDVGYTLTDTSSILDTSSTRNIVFDIPKGTEFGFDLKVQVKVTSNIDTSNYYV